MKVTIERTALLKALGHIHRIVERRNTIPILSNVLIEANEGRLALKSTDLDLEATEIAAADVALWGARNLDPPEAEFIASFGIGDDPAPVLESCDAVSVAIDLDVLEPGEVAVFMPEPGGPSLADVERILTQVRESGRLAGAGFSGLAPDPANVEPLHRLTAALGL